MILDRTAGWTRTLLACATALTLGTRAQAGGTHTFKVSDFDEFDEGEVEGAAIEGSGRVTVGYLPDGTDMKATTAFTCHSNRKDTVVGTSDPATVSRVTFDRKSTKPKLEQIAKLPGVVVSALSHLPNGDVLAATLPGGTLHRIDRKGKVTEFADLDAEQIWALEVSGDRVYAGTGPKGRLYSLSATGTDAKVILDSDEKHIMSITAVGSKVVAGTGPRAKVLLVADEPDGILLHDFTGDEVRALRVSGHSLVAAVNDFDDRKMSNLDALTKRLNRTSLVGATPSGTLGSRSGPTASAKIFAVDLGPKLDVDRASEAPWEKWLSKEKQYFTELVAVGAPGTVMVSSSSAGKIYRARGLRDVATVADLEQRQATSLCVVDRGNVIATTGDGAAVYRLQATPATKARYVSEVFDADHPANYGAIRLRGVGPFVVRARTGPTDEPDKRWTDWMKVDIRRSPGGLQGDMSGLPKRRYLQIEVGLAGPAASVRELVVFYAPENLAPLIKSIAISHPDFDLDDDDEPSSNIKIKWKADARDEDNLIYEVRVRPEGGKDDEWIKLHDDSELVTKKELEWDVSTMPDGVYEIDVTASDEPSNGSQAARTDHLVSDPVVIDRGRPRVSGARAKGLVIRGTASDDLSIINDVTFSIDGGPFRTASAVDGLYDEPNEAFEVRLPPDLKQGRHRVVVRARDAFGNITTSALVVEK